MGARAIFVCAPNINVHNAHLSIQIMPSAAPTTCDGCRKLQKEVNVNSKMFIVHEVMFVMLVGLTLRLHGLESWIATLVMIGLLIAFILIRNSLRNE